MPVPRSLNTLCVTASAFLAALTFGVSTAAAQTPCDPPANEIACENSKPGTPRSVWQTNGSGDPSIQGFATRISIAQGETVDFKVKTDATDYRLEIYRIGWDGGRGPRPVHTGQPSAALPLEQPDRLNHPGAGL